MTVINSDANNATTCLDCEPGQFQVNPADISCVICPTGYYMEEEGSEFCLPCIPGLYQDSKGKQNCTACPTGQFQNSSAMLVCYDCRKGMYQSEKGKSNCFSCVPGQQQEEIAAKKCKRCKKGEFQPHSTKTVCIKCKKGMYQQKSGQTLCLECIPGQYQDKVGEEECRLCDFGRHQPDNANISCIDCKMGMYQSERGKSFCLPCSPGSYQNRARSKSCLDCGIDTYSARPKSIGCVMCKKGETAIEKSAACTVCPAGKANTPCEPCKVGEYRGVDDNSSVCLVCALGRTTANAISSTACTICSSGRYGSKINVCEVCDLGQYRLGDNVSTTDSTICIKCPAGFHQNIKGQSLCFSCVPGKFQNVTGQAECQDCQINTYSKSSEINCKSCEIGKDSKLGSATCSLCESGQFATLGKSCTGCPAGWKRGNTNNHCVKCPDGEIAKPGSTDCDKCDVGKYHVNAATCLDCPVGKFQDTKAKLECKLCKNGRIPNNNKTACQRPDWVIAEECDYTTQYLNDSSNDRLQHRCVSCPNGASCEGNIAWKNVKAKFGYWRAPFAQPNEPPPDCLNKQIILPTCAFVPCVYPPACRGSPNPEHKEQFSNLTIKDLSALTETEACDIKTGHAQNKCGTHKNESCRLCGTCRIGYKRTGAGTQCKLCPSSTQNKIFLAIGFFIMLIGSTTLIYMTIQAAASGDTDDASDAIKKIILNFLQMSALAGGLPLRWPETIEDMFSSMETVSSAGTTLLIPDCELTHIDPADAFYMKQIAFTFIVPIVVLCCCFIWYSIDKTCSTRCKLTKENVKDYLVLSIVLLLFLLYPTIVKLTLSTLKCPYIGDGYYLMSALQEPCFKGRHQFYMHLLTIPQLILYVFGLPLIGFLIIVRAGSEKLKEKTYILRYGLLFAGYREGREWWEVVIVLRKIAIVSVGTFGTLFRAVDLQAFLALAIVFLSIIAHLVGTPFDLKNRKKQALHRLEFFALAICWWTFWGGLIFFLGQAVVAVEVLMAMTILIVVTNVIFLIWAIYLFGRAFVKETMEKKKKKKSSAQQGNNQSHVVPVNYGKDDDDEEESHDAHVTRLHSHFERHEKELQEKHKNQRNKSHRNTQMRVEARAKLIRSKVMRKVRIFQQLDDNCLTNLIEHMHVRTFAPDEEIILQGAPATCFYIITSGSVSVTQKTIDDLIKGHEVAQLGENAFFGEHALELGHNEFHVCNATVTAIGIVRTLFMENIILEELVEEGIINRVNLDKGIKEEQERRERMTRVKLLMKTSGFHKVRQDIKHVDNIVTRQLSTNERSLFS